MGERPWSRWTREAVARFKSFVEAHPFLFAALAVVISTGPNWLGSSWELFSDKPLFPSVLGFLQSRLPVPMNWPLPDLPIGWILTLVLALMFYAPAFYWWRQGRAEKKKPPGHRQPPVENKPHPSRESSTPAVEILEGSLPKSLEIIPESIGWQLKLRLENKGARAIAGVRGEVHSLERFSERNGEFIEDAEPFGIARLKFEQPETTTKTIGGEDSLSYVLVDASQKTTLRVMGEQEIRPQTFQPRPLITTSGTWREEIYSYSHHGNRRIQVFFKWGPGGKPVFVLDPRELQPEYRT